MSVQPEPNESEPNFFLLRLSPPVDTQMENLKEGSVRLMTFFEAVEEVDRKHDRILVVAFEEVQIDSVDCRKVKIRDVLAKNNCSF